MIGIPTFSFPGVVGSPPPPHRLARLCEYIFIILESSPEEAFLAAVLSVSGKLFLCSSFLLGGAILSSLWIILFNCIPGFTNQDSGDNGENGGVIALSEHVPYGYLGCHRCGSELYASVSTNIQ